MALASLVFASIHVHAMQGASVLRITVTVVDAEQRAIPLARHALMVGDDPPSLAPRRIVTTADGTAEIRLRPGRYRVESDQPSTLQGRAYRWNQSVELVAGREATLELTAANAEIGAITAATTAAPAAPSPDEAPISAFASTRSKWQESVVAIWTERRHTAGFVASNKGFIATSARGIADASSIEVQVSPTEKVAGRVAAIDEATDFALVAVNPSAVANVPPLPLDCAAAAAARAPAPEDLWNFDVPFFGVETATFDLALTGLVCVTVATLEQRFPVSTMPTVRLPVESSRPLPLAEMRAAAAERAFNPSLYATSSSDFDIVIITPVLRAKAQMQRGRTGAPNARDTIRPLTDFGEWSEYVSDSPPVVFVRASPKMVESFWLTLVRGAATTQGAALPPIKHLGPGFSRMRLLCGTAEIPPIHPFRIRSSVSETEDADEGFYAYDPMAISPHCGKVSLILSSVKDPSKTETKVIPPAVVTQVWNDFAPYRERR
jgi:hypothetical protein